MDRRRVLLICYYFPPLGGAGINRPLSLFKYLPRFGVECDVLTVKPVAYFLREPELLDGLDLKRVHRAGSRDPQRLLYLCGVRRLRGGPFWRGQPAWRRLFPDSKVGWVKPAIRLGRKLCANDKYDAMISTSPPVSCHLVAQSLAREFGIRWIADFRDPWTSVTAEEWHRSGRKDQRARRLLDSFVAAAGQITTVNEYIRRYVGAGVVITNGYDPALAALWKAPPQGTQFVIGVIGTLDDLRPLEPLLVLLRQVGRLTGNGGRLVRVVQVGRSELGDIAGQIRQVLPDAAVEIFGAQPRAESITILNRAHALYLGVHAQSGAGVTTGRVFDLLASGRPLLVACAPASELDGLIRSTASGITYSTDNPGSVRSAAVYLESLLELWQKQQLTPGPLPEYARPFAADVMASRFAELIGG